MKHEPVGACGDPARVETVDLVLQLSHVLGANLGAVAGRHGLTPTQARAMIMMEEPAPMRDLAERMYCDKSNVTGLVDGLERHGLVIRQPDPHDRRIKQLVFTAAGRRLRGELKRQLYAEAPGISGLSAAEEHQLRGLLRKALAEVPPAVA